MSNKDTINEFKCCTCGTIENIWCSVNVEMPIGIPCRVCQSKGRQITLQNGMLKPTGGVSIDALYIPSKGERIIIEYTPEMFMLYNMLKVKSMWNVSVHNKPMLSEVFKTQREAANELQKTYKPNKPFIITL